MALGPVELLLKFPGNEFKGEIIGALEKLVNSDTIRIVDLLFAKRDGNGNVKVLELYDLDKDACAAFDPLVSDITAVLTKEDVQKLTSGLESNSSAALMVLEDTWAIRFRDAVLNANGRVLFSERIPRAVIEEAMREPERAAGASDLTAKVQEFANLKESGVLTDEEFAAVKAKLLGI